jgi:RNA polymerase sigma factor (sigma-70 family)
LPERRHMDDRDTTVTLIARARLGRREARNQLMTRYLPILERWASGRLPARARSMHETGDLVQETLIKALAKLDQFEYRREGAFLAYLRKCLVNRIRDLVDRAEARYPKVSVPETLLADGPSPVDAAIGAERVRAYEAGLEELPHDQRVAVILRIEMGFNYTEIARSMGRPSSSAARMLVKRGILKLTEVIDHETD